MQADKHAITQQLGVQLRDLRLLDPQLHSSYPSALLCRDKALVVNLEHIKCIITKDEVLILNADEESVVRLHTTSGIAQHSIRDPSFCAGSCMYCLSWQDSTAQRGVGLGISK